MTEKIGIVGLGVIGGSIARALKKNGEYYICAVDTDENNLIKAKNLGAIDEYCTCFDVIKDCSVVYVCVPVLMVEKVVKDVYSVCKDAIITDVASTKNEIYNNIKALNADIKFVAGHPMSGSEKQGFGGAQESMFENAYYVICSDNNVYAEKIAQLAELMGAIPIRMAADEHDSAVAFISHLPHIAASALCACADYEENCILSSLCAGGFKDITRIASANPYLWSEIIKSGSKTVIRALDKYIDLLVDIRENIKTGSIDRVENMLIDAKKYRDSINDTNKGAVESFAQIWISVNDTPGIIGKVATLLGENNINIKNLRIENSREYEGGCLRIDLMKKEDAVFAKTLLMNNGFDVIKV